jgi:hypothetical protein
MEDDDPSPAEQMVHDLGLDPALDERIEDDPLLRQARRNVADTARRARELRDVPDDDEPDPKHPPT